MRSYRASSTRSFPPTRTRPSREGWGPWGDAPRSPILFTVSDDQTLARFQREYQSYHSISDERSGQQLRLLRQLADHAGQPLTDCGASEVQAFMGHLNSQDYHPNTLQKKLKMLKPFYGWAFDVGLIDGTTLMGVQRVRAPRDAVKTAPRPYTRKDLDRFRTELADRWPLVPERFWVRWRNGTSRYKRVAPEVMRVQIEAITNLALHCGLRRQEIFNGSLDDFHYDNEYIVVRYAKDWRRGKFREVPQTEASRQSMHRWIELRSELKPSHDAVWLSGAYESTALNAMSWKRFGSLLGTVGDWELHRFRHTAATEWLRAGVSIELVSRFLGHATVQQTLAYAELLREDIHKAVAKAEPAFTEAVL